LSNELAKICTGCVIDKATRRIERPSDHAPVMVELKIGP
jgi:exodeoxyribonuclease III